MQLKAFTATIAALSVTTAHAAAVKRVTISAGSIEFPSITLDPNGVHTAVSGLLDQLEGDIERATAILLQLNQVSDAVSKSVLARAIQAVTIITRLQAQTRQINQNVNSAVKKITAALPALPALPAKPSPTTPGNGATATPAANGAEALTQSLTSITTKAEEVLSQAKNLTAAANTQFEELSKQISQQLAATTAAVVPIIGQTAAQTTTHVSAIVTKLVADTGSSLSSISNTAQSALGTAQNAVQAVAQTTTTTAQGAVTSLITRIANAKLELNPVLVVGFTPKITI
ncbi:uncharacterized protein CTRU02_214424 [Colletotrichum truncatum]|uniref:Uncharacterized protein n=1 Tax=Colletotrichum truncatum TaxID=5467 RepID=A0ACC3YES8_COLTU|nr:uncharacterized protein CTRU02_13471 [Colletotrichum truncatum]KAF6783235.1 hypothetical protein CTRU02_13471 [Colletotrichum truncatum]